MSISKHVAKLVESFAPELAKLVSSFKLSKLPAKSSLEAPRDADDKLVSSQCDRIKLFASILTGYADDEARQHGFDATPCAATLGYILQIAKSDSKLFTIFLTLFADESLKLSTLNTIKGNVTKYMRRSSIDEVIAVQAYASQFALISETSLDERFLNWIESNWKRFQIEASKLREEAKLEARKRASS